MYEPLDLSSNCRNNCDIEYFQRGLINNHQMLAWTGQLGHNSTISPSFTTTGVYKGQGQDLPPDTGALGNINWTWEYQMYPIQTGIKVLVITITIYISNYNSIVPSEAVRDVTDGQRQLDRELGQ